MYIVFIETEKIRLIKHPKFITTIMSCSFLDWWNDQTIKTQQDWLKRHDDTDSNRKIALANQKGRKILNPHRER